MAIAAVVLGGTAITGGRGTIGGTLLGVAGIVILQNGLRLADLPAELAGILTGGLLLATIAAFRLRARRAAAPSLDPPRRAPSHTERSPSRCGTRSWPRSARWFSRQASSSPAATGGWCDRSKGCTTAWSAGPPLAVRVQRLRDARAAGDHHRHDAEGEGRSVLRELPAGRRGSGAPARGHADLGRSDGSRSRAAERSGGRLDHPRRRRDRGERREQGEHLDGAAEGAQAAGSR